MSRFRSFSRTFLVATFLFGSIGAFPSMLIAADGANGAVAEKTDDKANSKAEARDAEASQASDSAKSSESSSSDASQQQASDESAPKTDSKAKASGEAPEKSGDAPSDSAADESPKEKANGSESNVKHESKRQETTAKASTPEKVKGNRVRFAVLTIKSSLTESAGQVGPFGESRLDLREFINRLDRAAQDKTIDGIVLNIQNASLGRGKIEDMRSAIARYRESGKKIYAHLESAMPADYLIACACDEITLPETGVIMLPGVHAEATFYKGLLDRVGIDADFIHVGAYKGAAEPLTRNKFSEAVRANMSSMIDSLYDDMVTTIVRSRPLSIAQARQVIDEGLITATRAKELGLIDRVAYPDGLRNDLAKAHSADPLVYVRNYGQKKVDTDFSGPMGFFKLMQAMMGTDNSARKSRGKKIAVVYAMGPIMTGKSRSDLFGDSTMGSTTIVEALRKASNDDEVAAIVLRVDSPGGSALASDLIWHETQVIKKPIVASMGDVAASGGYYISMGADKIFAAPGTVTGSIGVVGGKLAVRGLYEKLGITTETIGRGANSGMFASSAKFTDTQRAVVENMMKDIYRQFTAKAADGRNMPLEQLEKLAGGQIFTGRQAKENGLVDELGTLHDAIQEAKKLADIDPDESVRIETLPEPTNFFESLFGDLGAEEEVGVSISLQGIEGLSPELLDIARRASRLRAAFDQPAALVMPFELKIR